MDKDNKALSEIRRKAEKLINEQTENMSGWEKNKSEYRRFLFSPALISTDLYKWLENRMKIWDIINYPGIFTDDRQIRHIGNRIKAFLSGEISELSDEEKNELQEFVYRNIDVKIYRHIFDQLKIKNTDLADAAGTERRTAAKYLHVEEDGKYYETVPSLSVQEKIYNYIGSQIRSVYIYEISDPSGLLNYTEPKAFFGFFSKMLEGISIPQQKLAALAQEHLVKILKESVYSEARDIALCEQISASSDLSDIIEDIYIDTEKCDMEISRKLDECGIIRQKNISRIISGDSDQKLTVYHEAALLYALRSGCYDDSGKVPAENFGTWAVLSSVLGYLPEEKIFEDIKADIYDTEGIREIRKKLAVPGFDENDPVQRYLYQNFELFSGREKILEKYSAFADRIISADSYIYIQSFLEKNAFVRYSDNAATRKVYRTVSLIQRALADHPGDLNCCGTGYLLKILSVISKKESEGYDCSLDSSGLICTIARNIKTGTDKLYLCMLLYIYAFNGGMVYSLIDDYRAGFRELMAMTPEERKRYDEYINDVSEKRHSEYER